MVKMVHESVRRQYDEKKTLSSPLQHSDWILTTDTFLATTMVKRKVTLFDHTNQYSASLIYKENPNHITTFNVHITVWLWSVFPFLLTTE
jgi:hypothetical protein